ncbi:MAG: glycosyl transferase family 2 [Pseudomonadota bacterium]
MAVSEAVHQLVQDDMPELSVVVVAEGDGKGLEELMDQYREALDGLDRSYEVIFLHDAGSSVIASIAASLGERWPNLVRMPQRPWAGDDAAMKIGITRASGETIMTLPAWPEIDPASIPALLERVGEADMVIGNRQNLDRSGMQKVRAGLTHGLLRVLFQQRFQDVFCRSRAGTKEAFQKAAELGVRQHFLPLVAVSEGYQVEEVAVDIPKAARNVYRFKPQAHVSAFVDMLSLYVGLKFLKRPLRFFGAIGLPLMMLGLLITAVLVVERLFFGSPLADRPALVFSVMMVVLGIQIVALGLVGEIIIFSSSRHMRNFEIDEIIRGRPSADGPAEGQKAAEPPEGDKP